MPPQPVTTAAAEIRCDYPMAWIPSCVLFRHKSQLALELFAQQVLLNLARHRLREAVHEAHIARHLVVGNLSATELADVLCGRPGSIAQPDAGADLFTIPAVRNPHHGNIEHRG